MLNDNWKEVWERKGNGNTRNLRHMNGYENTEADAEEIVSKIISMLKIRPNHRVLEVGCGAGYLARVMAPMCRYVGIDSFVQEQENLLVDYGALVIRGQNEEVAIMPDSAADKAGIIEGDIILELNGQKITTDNNLGEEIIKHSVGEEVSLKILRNTEEININIILEERDI